MFFVSSHVFLSSRNVACVLMAVTSTGLASEAAATKGLRLRPLFLELVLKLA